MAVLSPLKASSSSFRGPPHCQKAELEEPVVAADEEEEPYVPDDDAVAEEPEEKNEDMLESKRGLEGWKELLVATVWFCFSLCQNMFDSIIHNIHFRVS